MKQKTFFFPSPKKQRLLKEKDNEKRPAQQGSTLKRKIKIILTVTKAQGLFFFSKKKREQAKIYPNKQTKQRTKDKDKHALTLNKNALTTLTHNSPHKLKM